MVSQTREGGGICVVPAVSRALPRKLLRGVQRRWQAVDCHGTGFTQRAGKHDRASGWTALQPIQAVVARGEHGVVSLIDGAVSSRVVRPCLLVQHRRHRVGVRQYIRRQTVGEAAGFSFLPLWKS